MRNDKQTEHIVYILYDIRAMNNTDDAVVFDTDTSLDKLRSVARDYGGGVIYKYKNSNGRLVDEEFIEYVAGGSNA